MAFKPLLTGCLLLAFTHTVFGEQTTVAVAANFSAPMKALVAEFERTTAHRVKLSFGSSGKFFAQIRNGAPYDILFSADQAKPQALLAQGLAQRESRFTYAVGELVLWSANTDLLANGNGALLTGQFTKLAIANPRLAPYGQAAQQVLNALSLPLSGKVVQGENIAQTFQFVRSGNADMGFVAVSQVLALPEASRGSHWEIPEHLYSPINQDAVLLNGGLNNPAARALLAFTRKAKARRIIERFGYSLPPAQ